MQGNDKPQQDRSLGQLHEIQVNSHTVTSYLAIPEAGQGPGVLLLHPWWGLTDFFKQLCHRLSRQGFVVLAPDLYHGKTATTIEEAESLRDALDDAQAEAEVRAAAGFLKAHPAVVGDSLGVVCFSLGARWGLGIAEQQPDDVAAVVAFYGTREGPYNQARAAFLGHFGSDDEWEPLDEVQALESALRAPNREVNLYVYPNVRHWFFEENRVDDYDASAATLAWERTIAFLNSKLRR